MTKCGFVGRATLAAWFVPLFAAKSKKSKKMMYFRDFFDFAVPSLTKAADQERAAGRRDAARGGETQGRAVRFPTSGHEPPAGVTAATAGGTLAVA